MRICKVDGCLKKHRAKGFCGMHNWRLKNNGTTDNLRRVAFKANQIKTDLSINQLQLFSKSIMNKINQTLEAI